MKYNVKIKFVLFILCLGVLLSSMSIISYAVSTPGTMSFQVYTVSYVAGDSPKNIGAIWIENSAGVFVKSLKVWAAVRENYLTSWIAATSTHNKVDAVTSATISAEEGWNDA